MIGNVNAKPRHFWVWLYQSRNLRYCGGSSWTSVVRRTLDLRIRILPQVALVTLEYFSTWELEPYLRLWAFKVSMVYGRTPDNYTNCRHQIRTPLGKFWEKVGCQNPDKIFKMLLFLKKVCLISTNTNRKHHPQPRNPYNLCRFLRVFSLFFRCFHSGIGTFKRPSLFVPTFGSVCIFSVDGGVNVTFIDAILGFFRVVLWL